MNLDLLISKYLDGELSVEEDVELRARLKNSTDEKEEFSDAIILSDALRRDAENIHLPEWLIKDTEDKILMKILANAPIIDEKPVRYGVKRIAFALAIIAFLFLNIFKIDDLFIDKYTTSIDTALDELRNELVTKQNDVMPIIRIEKPHNSYKRVLFTSNLKQNTTIIHKVNDLNKTETKDYSPNDNYTISVTESISNENTNNSTETIKENQPIENYDIYNSATAISPSSAYTYNDIANFQKDIGLEPLLFNPNLFNSNDNITTKSFNYYNKIESGKVELSSFFGTDISRTGFNADNNTAISHFSQSIGYSVDKINKIGVEFGYTQYNYTDNIMVNVPINGQPNYGVKENPEIGHGQDEFISIPFPVNQKKQMLWASAFYENSIYNYSNFSLLGRAAIGGSNDGPITYGRLFARYEFIKGISATIGTEGRLFFAKLPDISNTEQNLKSTFSLIYGFQIIF